MVAIIRQQIIIRAEKLVRHLLHNRIYLLRRAEGEALEQCAAECAAGWFELGFREVDAGGVAAVVAAVGIFAAADYDARVQEGAAERPEDGGEAAGLCLLEVCWVGDVVVDWRGDTYW
jgi:hypothetical protein